MHDDRYERGRDRFLEVHDEKALAAVEGLGDLGRLIVETVYGDVYRGLASRRAIVSSRPSWRWSRSDAPPSSPSTCEPP
jgi:hypothetical protein